MLALQAKLDQKIEMQLPAEEELPDSLWSPPIPVVSAIERPVRLPVLRAFVILNRVADVNSLLYDYRDFAAKVASGSRCHMASNMISQKKTPEVMVDPPFTP